MLVNKVRVASRLAASCDCDCDCDTRRNTAGLTIIIIILYYINYIIFTINTQGGAGDEILRTAIPMAMADGDGNGNGDGNGDGDAMRLGSLVRAARGSGRFPNQVNKERPPLLCPGSLAVSEPLPCQC